MSEEEFESMFVESLKRLDAYIATQVTDAQKFQAQNRKDHVARNKPFYRHWSDKGEKLVLCSHCGAIDSTSYVQPNESEMLEHGLCFTCNHWRKLVEEKNAKRLIIGGEIYGDAGNRPHETRRHLLGFGGSVFKIERDGKVWETNNLFHGSTIPHEYRDRMPDNARFVK